MKKFGKNRNPAAHSLQHEAFGMPDGKEIFTITTPEQTTHQTASKDNIIGLCEDLRFKRLTAENKRLAILVEDLVSDKGCQAQRITELNEETSRLKKALAGLVLDRQD
jgi:hypothetical protein